MGIKAIEIKNILSFEHIKIKCFEDVNCIIGMNNAGKSNLIKTIKYFYQMLQGQKLLPPELKSNYSKYGSITISYDTSRIISILRSSRKQSNFFRYIYKLLFADLLNSNRSIVSDNTYSLTLKINSNGSTLWSVNDKNILKVINYLFPFFIIDARHINLYDWEDLWDLISRLKSFNVNNLNTDEVIEFLDSRISKNNNSYKEFINILKNLTETDSYNYEEKLLNLVKIGLKGQNFMIDEKDLEKQSDGTNSFTYINVFLKLIITLTRREYITPSVFIDEPEVGLHPKNSEKLIFNLYSTIKKFKKTTNGWEKGKYSTPLPTIVFSTHSPNILKSVLKLFNSNYQVLHFSYINNSTILTEINSKTLDDKFLNVFDDDAARLFFSENILFVEGATELELFNNLAIKEKFPVLQNYDVFQTDKLILDGVDPANSNLKTPYLVLYDIDKFIFMDYINKKIKHSKKDGIDILSLQKKINRRFFTFQNLENKKSINEILHYIESYKLSLDGEGVTLIDFDISLVAKKLNEVIFDIESKVLNSTTIEGLLISKSSFGIFSMWLIDLVLNYFSVKNLNARYKEKLIKDNNSGELSNMKLFSKLFHFNPDQYLQNEENQKANKKHKILFLKSFRIDLNKTCYSQEQKIILLRVIFNGKTDSLLSFENKQYNIIVSKEFRDYVSYFRSNYFSLLNGLNKKTGGWVTSYINFSVKYLEDKSIRENTPFTILFNDNYPELYDIIKKL